MWVGARRDSSEDPEGYRWSQGVELRRTASDILTSEKDESNLKHYPLVSIIPDSNKFSTV